MALHSEMRTLTLDLLQNYNQRMAEVASLIADARQDLANFRGSHQSMTAGQQLRLDEFMDSLHREVNHLRIAATSFVDDLDANHQAMAEEQRQRLAEDHSLLVATTKAFRQELKAAKQAMTQEQQHRLNQYMDGLHQTVSSLRSEAAGLIEELNSANQVMAAEQRQQLSEQRSHLSAETAAFRDGLAQSHRDMSLEQQQMLSEHVEALRQQVGIMRQEYGRSLEEVRAAQQAAAAAQQERLVTGREHLADDVAAMRQKYQAMLSAIHADHANAHKLWSNFKLLKQQMGPRKPATRPLASDQPTPEPSDEKSAPEAAIDDLSEIHGIGPSTVQHLNRAGVFTFAQLAMNTPEELRQSLGAGSRLAKVEEWIAQARHLAE